MAYRNLLIIGVLFGSLCTSEQALSRASRTDNGTSPVMPHDTQVPPPPVFTEPPPVQAEPPPKRKPVYRKPAYRAPAPARAHRAAPEKPSTRVIWEFRPSNLSDGSYIVTNRRDFAMSAYGTGEPFMGIYYTDAVPREMINTSTSVNFVVDGTPFLDLPADVSERTLVIHDPRLLDLANRIATARTLRIVNAYAVRDVDLAGLQGTLEKLRVQRERQAANTSPQPSTGAAQGIASKQIAPSDAGAGTQADDNFAMTGAGMPRAVDRANMMSSRIADLSAQFDVLSGILQEQTKRRDENTDKDAKEELDRTVWATSARLASLKKKYASWTAILDRLVVTLKPEERVFYVDKPKVKQPNPGFPFVDPSSGEEGEFWIASEISDAGDLKFNVFTDDPALQAKDDKPPILTTLTLNELEQTQDAVGKLYGFSRIAEEQKIKQDYANRIVCFPAPDCPPVREKAKPGQVSTEVKFVIFSQGATGGQILHNKGPFQEAINFSIDNALVLHAYLDHVIKDAKLNLNSGRSPEDLDKLFK